MFSSTQINGFLEDQTPRLELLLCLKIEAEYLAFMFMRAGLKLEGKKKRIRHQKSDKKIEKKKKKNWYVLV